MRHEFLVSIPYGRQANLCKFRGIVIVVKLTTKPFTTASASLYRRSLEILIMLRWKEGLRILWMRETLTPKKKVKTPGHVPLASR